MMRRGLVKAVGLLLVFTWSCATFVRHWSDRHVFRYTMKRENATDFGKEDPVSKKVLITDKVVDACIEKLEGAGCEVDVKLGLTPDQLREVIPEYNALIVRSATEVTREVIEAADNLSVIGRAGVVVDNIDIVAATERGIIVCNAPVSNIISAAELVMGLMLGAARKVVPADMSMKRHEWSRADFVGTELYEKTLAIFGLGRVGGLVAERAKAFGMRVVAHDPFCSPERADALGVSLYAELDEILPLADFITVHLPKTETTIGMFGPSEFDMMKDGVILVNCARGGIFQEEALADFMAAGKVSACGVDAFESEPCFDSPLHEFSQAILTPHLVGSTYEAQMRAGTQIAEYVIAGLEGSIVPTAVNLSMVPPEVLDAIAPYVPACQLMGSTLAQIEHEIPTTLTVTVSGSLAGHESDILTAGALDGLLSYRSSMHITADNAVTMAKRHGIKVETLHNADAGEYSSTVSVQADNLSMACTLIDSGQTTRIVSLLGYKIDIVPAKHGLILEYVDKPGRMGVIGTILGKAGVNISTMQIGTSPSQEYALVYMNVGSPVPDEVLDELRNAMDLENLWYIKL